MNVVRMPTVVGVEPVPGGDRLTWLYPLEGSNLVGPRVAVHPAGFMGTPPSPGNHWCVRLITGHFGMGTGEEFWRREGREQCVGRVIEAILAGMSEHTRRRL